MPHRRAFTLFETIVVIAIVGVLIVLLLTAVNNNRDIARRTTCMNNLKEIGLAMLSYESYQRVLPPGSVSPPGDELARRQGALAAILPYMEEIGVYHAMNIRHGPEAASNVTARSVAVRAYSCPSDVAPQLPYGGTNYALVAGNLPSLAWDGADKTRSPNGMFFQISSVKLRDVTDGLSKTMMGMEILRGQKNKTDSARSYAVKEAPLPTPLGPAADRGNQRAFDRGSSWMVGGFLQTLATATLPPNTNAHDLSFGLLDGGLSSGRSLHPGGLHLLLADGSVQFQSNSVELKVLQAMASRAGDQ